MYHPYSQKILELFNGAEEDVNQGIELLRSIGPSSPEIALDMFSLPNPWTENRLPRQIDDKSQMIWDMIGWLLDQGKDENILPLQQIRVLPVRNIHRLHPKLDLLPLEKCVINLKGVSWSEAEEHTPMSLKYSKAFKCVHLSDFAGAQWIESWTFDSLIFDLNYDVQFVFEVSDNTEDVNTECHKFCRLLTTIGSRTTIDEQMDMSIIAGQSSFQLKVVTGVRGDQVDMFLATSPFTKEIQCKKGSSCNHNGVDGNFPFLSYDEPTLNWDTVHDIDEIRWQHSLFSNTWGSAPEIELYLRFDPTMKAGTLRERLIEAQLEYIQYDFSTFPKLQNVKVWNVQSTAFKALRNIPSHIEVELLSNIDDVIDSMINHHRQDARERGERYDRDWLDEPEHLYHSSRFQIGHTAETRLLLGLGYPLSMNCSGNRYKCIDYLLKHPKEAGIPFGCLFSGTSSTFSDRTMKSLCGDLSEEGYLVLDRMIRAGLRNVPNDAIRQIESILKERNLSTEYYKQKSLDPAVSEVLEVCPWERLEEYLAKPFTDENIVEFISDLDLYCDMDVLEEYLCGFEGISKVAMRACWAWGWHGEPLDWRNEFLSAWMERWDRIVTGFISPTLAELVLRLHAGAVEDADTEYIEYLRIPLQGLSAWLKHFRDYPSELCASYIRSSCEEIFVDGRVVLNGWSTELVSLLLRFVPKDIWYLELVECGLNEMPAEIFEFSNLERLILYHNYLSTIPQEVHTLTKLSCLSVSMNPNMVIPKALSSHPNISNSASLDDPFVLYAKEISSEQAHRDHFDGLDMHVAWE